MFVQLIDRRCSFNNDINTQDLETIYPTSHHWLHPCHVDDITIIQILFCTAKGSMGSLAAQKGCPYICAALRLHIFLLILV